MDRGCRLASRPSEVGWTFYFTSLSNVMSGADWAGLSEKICPERLINRYEKHAYQRALAMDMIMLRFIISKQPPIPWDKLFSKPRHS